MVSNRPCPAIQIGPVDFSCAFIVVDTRNFDLPIVYASEPFERLTGYTGLEVIGRNCRFLQSPDGQVAVGSRRHYTDNAAVHQIKNSVGLSTESQPFINLITIIPVTFNDVTYLVGLLVDMVEQPNAIITEGEQYANSIPLPPYLSGVEEIQIMDSFLFQSAADSFESVVDQPHNGHSQQDWNRLLIENSEAFVHVLTLKGIFQYASPSSCQLFGLNSEALLGRSISEFCHPNDIGPIMRELKDSTKSPDQTLELTFRIGCSNGEFVWMESIGKLCTGFIKCRRYIIFSGRVRPQVKLSLGSALASDLDGEFWSRISLGGLYLFVTAPCFQATGYSSDELIGTSMYQLIHPDSTAALTQVLQQVQEGDNVQLFHQIRNRGGQTLTAASRFYPIGTSGTVLCCTRVGGSSNLDKLPFLSVTTAPSDNNLNLFEALEPDKATTWQYELHRLKLANAQLQQEISALSKRSSTEAEKVHPLKRLLNFKV
ncbi:hypothetical protein L0F63_001631 [Massospora cicadina]|nr:hypothetical protein L0F63_001631 [Massospora cicadina]